MILRICITCLAMAALDDHSQKPQPVDVSYVEFDFSTLPSGGEGDYSVTITVLTADKDLFYSMKGTHARRFKPDGLCSAFQVSMKINRFKAEVVDKTKLRVYGRIWNDKLIPATQGKVESPDLKKGELPKVSSHPKA